MLFVILPKVHTPSAPEIKMDSFTPCVLATVFVKVLLSAVKLVALLKAKATKANLIKLQFLISKLEQDLN